MPKIRVKSVPERFRRAGMEFTREAVEMDVDKKTLDILKTEPLLSVEEVIEKKDKDKEK